ncbi:solute carrier organic anion transporter family member 4A1-like [Amphiura filiformis]|uniref:solute carrier organic anion transporter family member 4A1-like n=1 Tax=Amphiura filiformis TaxID=82378 RepID=UPI003B214FA1
MEGTRVNQDSKQNQNSDGGDPQIRTISGKDKASEAGDNGTVKPPGGEDTTDTVDHRYGWCGWKPDCLQRINKPVWLLVFMSFYAFMQGLIVNGLINVVISTLEKRFDLPSRKTGLIASSYDIATATLVIFVSYYGGRGHKARWIAFGCVIFAVGGVVFGIPHFTTGLHTSISGSLVCVTDESTEECVDSSLSNYFYVFILSQVLHGIGVTPLYSIGVTLIDESVTVHQSALYMGIFYGLATIGPGIGYIVGGSFLNIYTDTGLVDVDSLGITPNDPGWIGAWWLGFFIGGVIAVLVAVPLFGFPSEFPGTKEIRAAKVDQAHQSKHTDHATTPGFGEKLSDFPRAVMYLVRNPTFVFLVLAGCSEGFVVSGFSTFGPKVVETQFGLTAADASLLFGICAIPGAGFGTILGGYLVKRWKLKIRGMVKFSCITNICTMVAVMTMLVRCSQELIVGVNVDFEGNMTNFAEDEQLINDCNSNCGCTRKEFNPVCGDNGMEYFDPCFAGCTQGTEDAQHFSDCSCLELAPTNTSLTVTAGKCGSDCGLLPIFLVGTVLLMTFHFLAAIPGVECILRCVPESQRSLAVGVQWIFIRVLGTIPGPIAFGAALDTSCILWQQDCTGAEGSCFLYSGSGIAWKFFLIGFGVVFVTLTCFLLSLWTYNGPADDEMEDETKDMKFKLDTDDYNRNVQLVSSSSQVGIVANESLPVSDDGFHNEGFQGIDDEKTSAKVYHVSHV